MLNCYVGIYDLDKDEAEVFAGFWSAAHAFDYASTLDRNIIRDARALFLHDMDGRVCFFSTGDDGAKHWMKYEDAVARDLCGILPLSAWSVRGVRAGKKVVTGKIRDSVVAAIRTTAAAV